MMKGFTYLPSLQMMKNDKEVLTNVKEELQRYFYLLGGFTAVLYLIYYPCFCKTIFPVLFFLGLSIQASKKCKADLD